MEVIESAEKLGGYDLSDGEGIIGCEILPIMENYIRISIGQNLRR